MFRALLICWQLWSISMNLIMPADWKISSSVFFCARFEALFPLRAECFFLCHNLVFLPSHANSLDRNATVGCPFVVPLFSSDFWINFHLIFLLYFKIYSGSSSGDKHIVRAHTNESERIIMVCCESLEAMMLNTKALVSLVSYHQFNVIYLFGMEHLNIWITWVIYISAMHTAAFNVW